MELMRLGMKVNHVSLCIIVYVADIVESFQGKSQMQIRMGHWASMCRIFY